MVAGFAGWGRSAVNAGQALRAIVLLLCSVAAAAATSSSVEQVWSLEAAYWKFAQGGDVEHFLGLWHEDAIGWPCVAGQQHPVGKERMGDWVRRIRDERARLAYRLKREGAMDLGAIVVVYYRTPLTYRYPDGRTVGEDSAYMFSHTWQQTGSSWQIITGMCTPLEPAPKE
jgi:hypothetical protein